MITHNKNNMCLPIVNGETITLEQKSEMSMAIYNHLFDEKHFMHSCIKARVALKRTTSTLDGYIALSQMIESINPWIGS